MKYIRNEIPAGDIDGVNVTFTLNNTPSIVKAVYRDGANDILFARADTVITMTDSPKYTLYVDYYI